MTKPATHPAARERDPHATRRNRARAAVATLLLVLAACGGGGATPPAASDTPAAGGDLSTLAGEWTGTPSNPRFTQRSGVWKNATVSLKGDQLEVKYRLGPNDYGSSTQSAGGGDFTIRCDTDSCLWGLHMVQESSGPPYRIVNAATLETPQVGCDIPAPAGAWVILDVTADSFAFSPAWSSGRGGADGCQDTFQVVWDVTATRVG